MSTKQWSNTKYSALQHPLTNNHEINCVYPTIQIYHDKQVSVVHADGKQTNLKMFVYILLNVSSEHYKNRLLEENENKCMLKVNDTLVEIESLLIERLIRFIQNSTLIENTESTRFLYYLYSGNIILTKENMFLTFSNQKYATSDQEISVGEIIVMYIMLEKKLVVLHTCLCCCVIPNGEKIFLHKLGWSGSVIFTNFMNVLKYVYSLGLTPEQNDQVKFATVTEFNFSDKVCLR